MPWWSCPDDRDDIVPLTLTPWVFLLESILNPPKSTNFVTHKMLVSWIHQNSASVDIGHILNPPKSTTNFLVDFGRFRIPCSHENLYSMLLHRIHQNLTYTVHVCNYMYNPSTNMTKQLKTIEILNPSKSATCSMWRYMYPESSKIFQYRGMDFDGFRVVRVNGRLP